MRLQARTQGDEKFVQLLELFGHRFRRPAAAVEGFLRGIEFVGVRSVLPSLSSKVTVVTAPSSLSSFVQTRREGGSTSRYLPTNAMDAEASCPNSRR